MLTVLVADSNPARRAGRAVTLRGMHCRVTEWGACDLVRSYDRDRPALAVVSSDETEHDRVLSAIRELRARHPSAGIILIASASSEALAVAAFRAGVADYFCDPVPSDQFIAGVRRALAACAPREESAERPSSPFVGGSAPMRDVADRLARIASHHATVLITGETGTGKELAAGLVHAGSARRHRPFVPVNCAAIPDSLLESELFGHERGAFTGAVAARPGMLQRANGGTVFLDEVGELSPLGQAKLLRAVETREVLPVGGRSPVPLDVRIVAATNQDLDRAVATGAFRKDLYFRLNVVRIHLPPLRQRSSDVPSLLAHFLNRFGRETGRAGSRFTEEALARLQAYGWPGNVRELKNLVEAVLADATTTQIGIGDLPREFAERLPAAAGSAEADRDRLLAALTEARWNKSRAARQLRCSRMTLYRWMAREHLDERRG